MFAEIETQNLYVSRTDHLRLQKLIESAQSQLDFDTPYLADLDARLQEAHFLQANEMPTDVVTMNSQLRLRFSDSGETRDYTIVFPHQADLANGKLSVLAPMGAAALGARLGDTISWQAPAGSRSAVVDKILYQPEARGNYRL